MKRRFRLLPVVIFAGTLALTLKVGEIWSVSDMTVSTASAANSEKQPAGEAKAEAPAKKRSDAGGEPGTDDGKAAGKKSGGVGDEFDPSSVTQAEFQVLQRLAKRRGELDKQQNDLALREQLLAATEKRLNAKLTELENLKGMIQDLLRKHDAEQEKKLKSLVKIYESMKAKDAARIFERLEMDVLLDVVERMREQKTASIMAEMDPGKAEAVTARLAERRQLPSPNGVTEGG